MKPKTEGAILLFALTLFCVQSSAWNKPGHMATGAIAYAYLKQHSPSTIPKIIAVLKNNPRFQDKWKPIYDGLPAAEKDIFLFMEAARWPDDIKEWYKTDHALDTTIHKESHYVDHPVSFTNVHTDPPKKENLLVAFKYHLARFKAQTTSSTDKAISLSWIFHLMGDIHQPLHNAQLFSNDFPTGDGGGNAFITKGTDGELHAYWDDIVVPDRNNDIQHLTGQWDATITAAYKKIMTDNPVAFSSAYKFDATKVSSDCEKLAKDHAYQYNGKKLVPGVKHGTTVVRAAQDFPAGVGTRTYEGDTRKLCSKQMATAGMRLAVLLKELSVVIV